MSLSLNNNINVWTKDDIAGGIKTPSYVIQGHAVIFFLITLLELYSSSR